MCYTLGRSEWGLQLLPGKLERYPSPESESKKTPRSQGYTQPFGDQVNALLRSWAAR